MRMLIFWAFYASNKIIKLTYLIIFVFQFYFTLLYIKILFDHFFLIWKIITMKNFILTVGLIKLKSQPYNLLMTTFQLCLVISLEWLQLLVRLTSWHSHFVFELNIIFFEHINLLHFWIVDFFEIFNFAIHLFKLALNVELKDMHGLLILLLFLIITAGALVVLLDFLNLFYFSPFIWL